MIHIFPSKSGTTGNNSILQLLRGRHKIKGKKYRLLCLTLTYYQIMKLRSSKSHKLIMAET